jgi:exodeoxyribonuclease V alpha subunit
MLRTPSNAIDSLVGVIERITFQSEDTGYTIAKIKPELRSCKTSENLARIAGREGVIPIIGTMATLVAGERMELQGYWVTHDKYGKQFKVTDYKSLQPNSVEGIQKYLGSGLIKGIGPSKAKIIVDHFGVETLDIIDAKPERLLEVKGVARKTVEIIQKGWHAQKHIQEVMQFLLANNVSITYAVKIYKTYGDDAIQMVMENPYRLSKDIWGVGFKTADQIAMNLGVDPRDPARIVAGARYVLQKHTEEGHVFVPLDDLIEESTAFLDVEPDSIPVALDTLVRSDEIVCEKDRVFMKPYYHAEQGIVRHLDRLINFPRPAPPEEQISLMIQTVEKNRRITFNDHQKAAIHLSFTKGVMVLTGGPGTGKTTCVQGVIDLFKEIGSRVILTAPTGRAAKRLSEVTGSEAKTMHRLLEFNPRTRNFNKGWEDQLDADVVILDEVSMVDTIMMNALLRAIPDTARFIMVGDADQLPSVGAGNVLRDIISSHVVPPVHLNEIFRQAQESDIIMNAHRVNQGEMPDVSIHREGDFFFISETDPAKGLETIRGLCTQRLPQKYGFDAIEDIQILTPMYRGEVGVDQLNLALQQALNPSGASLKRGDKELRVGDKVLQTRNNYDKMVFNGDIGRITSIDPDAQQVHIQFGEPVVYDYSDLDEVVLAYAISVHKSQGSEYKAVILPLYTTHYMMLQRNLLYTAITRAKMLVVIVGMKKALGIAVNNNQVVERYTGLREALVDKIG